MLKNGLYNIIGAVIRSGITFLTIPILIRLMGVDEYGLWTLVSTFIGILGLAEAGLSISTTVFLSKDLANNDLKGFYETLTITFGVMLVLATLTASLLLFGTDSLIMLFPKLETTQRIQAIQSIQIGGIVIWTRLLQQIFIGIEQAFQCYKTMNLINTLQICFTNIAMMVMAGNRADVTGLMVVNAAISLGSLSGHTCFSLLLINGFKFRPAWNRKKFLSIINYSSMTWITSIGSALFQAGDRLIVGSVLETNLLGIYAAITSITGQINQLSAIAIQPLLPQLSRLLEGKRTELIQQIKQTLQVNFIIVFGVGGIFLIFTPILMKIIFSGNSTQEHESAFRLATLIYMFYSINAVGYYTLLGLGAARLTMRISLIAGLGSIILILLGAHLWGLQGAILGNLGYAITIAFVFLAMKKLDIPATQWISWLNFSEMLRLPKLFFSKFNIINQKTK